MLLVCCSQLLQKTRPEQDYTELKAHFSHLQPVSPVTTLEVLQESVPEVQPGAALGRLPPSPYERQP